MWQTLGFAVRIDATPIKMKRNLFTDGSCEIGPNLRLGLNHYDIQAQLTSGSDLVVKASIFSAKVPQSVYS